MRTLVVAPHPDDESIGCGGRLALAAAAGEEIGAVFLTSGELGLEAHPVEKARAVREAEAEEAAQILGISRVTFLRQPDWFLADASAEAAKGLRRLVRREPPDRMLIPHPGEWHPDHAAAPAIVRMALGSVPGPIEIETYEVWTPMTIFADVEDISAVMATKLAAIRAYRSQLDGFSYDEAVEGLNRFRGALAARCRYAEVFGQLASRLSPTGDRAAGGGQGELGDRRPGEMH